MKQDYAHHAAFFTRPVDDSAARAANWEVSKQALAQVGSFLCHAVCGLLGLGLLFVGCLALFAVCSNPSSILIIVGS